MNRTLRCAALCALSGCIVGGRAWAVEADCNPAAVRSNSFTLEWPPRSGRVQEFPEIDRAAWFPLAVAREKSHKGQVALLDELATVVGSEH